MNILCKVLNIESAALYRDGTERMLVGICDQDGSIAKLTLRNGDGLKVGDTFWLYSEDEFAEPPPEAVKAGALNADNLTQSIELQRECGVRGA